MATALLAIKDKVSEFILFERFYVWLFECLIVCLIIFVLIWMCVCEGICLQDFDYLFVFQLSNGIFACFFDVGIDSWHVCFF